MLASFVATQPTLASRRRFRRGGRAYMDSETSSRTLWYGLSTVADRRRFPVFAGGDDSTGGSTPAPSSEGVGGVLIFFTSLVGALIVPSSCPQAALQPALLVA